MLENTGGMGIKMMLHYFKLPYQKISLYKRTKLSRLFEILQNCNFMQTYTENGLEVGIKKNNIS